MKRKQLSPAVEKRIDEIVRADLHQAFREYVLAWPSLNPSVWLHPMERDAYLRHFGEYLANRIPEFASND